MSRISTDKHLIAQQVSKERNERSRESPQIYSRSLIDNRGLVVALGLPSSRMRIVVSAESPEARAVRRLSLSTCIETFHLFTSVAPFYVFRICKENFVYFRVLNGEKEERIVGRCVDEVQRVVESAD